MATYSGIHGTASFKASTVAAITGWTLNIDIAEVDDTALGEVWKGVAGGLASWDGEFRAVFDASGTGQGAFVTSVAVTTPVVTTATLVLTHASGKTWTGLCLAKALSVTVGVNQTTEGVFRFVGDGQIIVVP